jgi:3-oxoadipate enol-lactonase
MATAEINGTTINYRIDGPNDAPALLMSNSLGTNFGMWDPQVDDFTKSYRMIRYDSRGHGQSGAPDIAYSMEMLANDALGLLDHLGVDKAYYCGLSKGGMIGQWMAAHTSERFHRMVFANTSAYMPQGATTWEDRVNLVTGGGMNAIVDMVIKIWLTENFCTANPDTVANVREMILATPPEGYCGCCWAIAGMDNRATNKSVKVPVLVIIGEHDIATPPDHGAAIAEAIPNAQSVILDSAHLSNIEDAAGFNKAVLNFLNGA